MVCNKKPRTAGLFVVRWFVGAAHGRDGFGSATPEKSIAAMGRSYSA